MLAGSIGVIARRFPEASVAALLFVVILQGLGYGLLFDLSFFLRNLSVVGGLLMVFSETLATKKKLFAGLPSISETDRRKYVQLAGRILLIFLFIGFIFQGNWSIARVFVSIVGLGACIMVAVGFKAKWSASFLVLLLSVFNVLVNKWWSVHPAHPQRDFLKYDFFQTLSIVGGLLLLVNMGPGGISVDEKKKVSVAWSLACWSCEPQCQLCERYCELTPGLLSRSFPASAASTRLLELDSKCIH
jgi:uncharacterized membrane protein YphA (DoxX/SURF4 family)